MNPTFYRLFVFFLLTLSSIAFAEDSADPKQVDFAREVLPILSNKCFVCHGPDAKKGELRLDSLEAATADLGGYRAINTEDVAKSEILNRIHSKDDPMPPEEAERQLTDSERDVITRWVKQGGEYALHWAFVRPEKAPIEDKIINPIDHFIGKELKTAGVDFAPEADKATLARRAALTLTGLPPEPKLLAEFLTDTKPGAYQRLIDQLLSSPRYGEHQARYWLDAVRYGDTHGLHLDSRRGIYPYRDWVVRAYNQNLPLDDFITWQLAGDLLPNATLDQQLATGYVRLNPSTGEGGAIAAEFQAKNNFDRVETLGTVFLGMSLTCARCHTHKYDPITQKEYYHLMAFFNSTAEGALDGNSYTYGPTVSVPENQRDWQEWSSHVKESDKLLAEVDATIDEKRKKSLLEFAKSRGAIKVDGWKISKPVPLDKNVSEKELGALKGLPGKITGRNARGKLPSGQQAVWVQFNIDVPVAQTLWITLSGNKESKVFLNDLNEPIWVKTNLDRSGTLPLMLDKGKQRIRIQMKGPLNEIETRISNPWQSLAKSGNWQTAGRTDKLLMLSDANGLFTDLGARKRFVELAGKLGRIEANFTTSLVARDLPKPRETKLLHRGEYHSPVGEPLQAGTVKVMSPFPESAPRNRLGLAQWLTSPEHPSVSRVLVNRLWQRTFGFGLVRTPEDFGLQGEQPTHPELLDWLAVELQESKWNLKQMLRMMVSSRTFRQQSNWRKELDDPENRLYARGPGYRLDAEVIRDVALWTSELLDPHMGGEGVKPYQPAGMWIALAHPASNTKSYVRDQGNLLYRRSLYVYWKRTSPHPMLTLFDAPDRESSCVRRSRTSTSLQSLGLLNETQRIEMGRKLGQRLLREAKDDSARLDLLFRLITCRKPNEIERKACMTLLEKMRKRYAGSSDDAIAYLSIGDAPRDEKFAPSELAAWSQLSVTVLASDLTILMY